MRIFAASVKEGHKKVCKNGPFRKSAGKINFRDAILIMPAITKRSIFPILGLAFFAIGCIRPDTPLNRHSRLDRNALIKRIADEGYLGDSLNTLTGEITDQQAAYMQLVSRSTADELEDLCNHQNRLVGAYAYQALAQKDGARLIRVFTDHLYDSSLFELEMGCFIESEQTVLFQLDILGYDKRYDYWHKLTPADRFRLDSLLLFSDHLLHQTFASPGGRTPASLRIASLVFENIRPHPLFYNRIKQFASEGRPRAIVALARYKNPEDLPFLLAYMQPGHPTNGRDFEGIVRCFPHPLITELNAAYDREFLRVGERKRVQAFLAREQEINYSRKKYIFNIPQSIRELDRPQPSVFLSFHDPRPEYERYF